MSETFDSDAKAKAFGAIRLIDSLRATAGTLNPVVPKRTIGGAEIRVWLTEP
jgi:hypothetical protein